MLDRDKVQLRNRNQLRHLFAVALILAAMIAASLLYLNSRNNYYERLSNEVQSITNDANQLPPIEITPTSGKLPPVTINDTASVKVIFYSESKHRISIEYYANKKLRAINYLDESEKLLRQDIFDLDGRIRIRLYYNSNSDLVQKEYYDESNRRVEQIPYFPFGGPRGPY